jgi:hypothetical protein
MDQPQPSTRPEDMDRPSKTSIRKFLVGWADILVPAIIGFVVAVISFAFAIANPVSAPPAAIAIALLLCPPSILSFPLYLGEPSIIDVVGMWLLIGIMNSVFYAGVGVTLSSHLKKWKSQLKL